jgi:pyruvate/2-oxoacid:ferredoxin oxidoreductase beta subunit
MPFAGLNVLARRFEDAPDALIRIAFKAARHHGVALVAAIVFERELAVAFSNAD